jgi:hypothetical protein
MKHIHTFHFSPAIELNGCIAVAVEKCTAPADFKVGVSLFYLQYLWIAAWLYTSFDNYLE